MNKTPSAAWIETPTACYLVGQIEPESDYLDLTKASTIMHLLGYPKEVIERELAPDEARDAYINENTSFHGEDE